VSQSNPLKTTHLSLQKPPARPTPRAPNDMSTWSCPRRPRCDWGSIQSNEPLCSISMVSPGHRSTWAHPRRSPMQLREPPKRCALVFHGHLTIEAHRRRLSATILMSHLQHDASHRPIWLAPTNNHTATFTPRASSSFALIKSMLHTT
jgi:hypothetical protein